MTARSQQWITRIGSFSTPRKRLRTAGRWAARVSMGLLALLVVMAASGFLYQEVASRNDREAFPAPGRLVDVGGHRLHLLEMGTAHDGPTVVLLPGASSVSAQWAWIQRDVAAFARVISYDRAGLGWSEASGAPKDARTAAEELRALLRAADVPGPYVLVGHSLGGAHARVFADLYRDEVAGMVLIDAGNPEFWTRVAPDALEETRATVARTRWFPYLARFGVLRVMDTSKEIAADLPDQQRKEVKALFASTRHAEATREEYRELLKSSDTMLQLGKLEPVTGLPFVVLTRTEPDDAYTNPQQAMDAELAKASTLADSHRLVAGADHFTIVTNAEYARETTQAVRNVLAAIGAP